MYKRVKTFTPNNPSGAQFLFDKNHFYMLQAWALWMSVHHRHDKAVGNYTDSNGTSAILPADNVIIHRDSVHTTNSRPVGYRSSIYNDIDILLSDHVANRDIHQEPGTSETVAENGQLISVGWTQPVKVRAIVAAPVFELLGHSMAGPMYIPFPTYNMSPIFSLYRNYRNQIDVTNDMGIFSPFTMQSGGKDAAMQWGTQGLVPGFSNSDIRPEYWGYSLSNYPYPVVARTNRSPYICDAKNRTNSDFLTTTHNYLYIIPPFMYASLNRSSLDIVSNTTETGNDISIFTYPPLFVDSRHTGTVLDRITRSGVLISDIINFKDLIGVYSKDCDKQDLFNSQADHTCWLSKYSSMVTTDEQSNYGASLFFKDFDQELNQFISEVNYANFLTGMNNINNTYWDFPFKVVTINFSVSNNIADDIDFSEFSIPQDANYLNEAKRQYVEHIVQDGFPRCFYKTDFEDTYAEAGGHNSNSFRPNEKFKFDIYPTGLREFKAWFYDKYRAIPEIQDAVNNNWNRYFNYFDFLNIPNGFDSGERQVLILKDPEQGSPIYKENPLSRSREMGYVILEGYVVIPYEIYSTSAGISSATGTLTNVESIDPVASDSSHWRDESTCPVISNVFNDIKVNDCPTDTFEPS
jgi:hypothetical protein